MTAYPGTDNRPKSKDMAEKLVKLTFKTTGEEHFFGSYSAIYNKFGNEDIGAVLGTIWNTVRLTGGRFENGKVLIEKVEVTRKKRIKNKE